MDQPQIDFIIKFMIIFLTLFSGLVLLFKLGIFPKIKWGDKELDFTKLTPENEKKKEFIENILNDMSTKLESMNSVINSIDTYKREAESNKELIKDLTKKNEYYTQEIAELNKIIAIYQEKEVKNIDDINKLILKLDNQLKDDIRLSCSKNHFSTITNFDDYVDNKIRYYISNLKTVLIGERDNYKNILDYDYKFVETLLDINFMNEFYSSIKELYYSFKNINIEVKNIPEFNNDIQEESDIRGILLSYYNYLLIKLNNNSTSQKPLSNRDLIISIKNENLLKDVIRKVINYKSSKAEMIRTLVLDRQLETASFVLYAIRKFFDKEFKKLLIKRLTKKDS